MIALLFLTIGDVNFPEIWDYYFKDNDNKYSIYCHVKYPETLTIKWMKDNLIKNKVKTEWGHFTNAYVELLKESIKNKSNTHFIFLSESCIPIKPLCKLIEFINQFDKNQSFISTRDYESFNIEKSNISKNYFTNFDVSNMIKHSGWFCLSMYHVKKLIEHPDVYKFNKIIAGDEHILSLICNKNTFNEFVNYEITYANWNYTKKQVEKLNKKLVLLYEDQEKNNISRKNEIFELRKQKSIIGKHPKIYKKIKQKNLNKIINSQSFFYRKFDKLSDINKYYKKILNGQC
jgi:hypothetical protein